MIYSHKLSSKNKRHKSFLEEKRNDPITGDKIIEGNEIVLCGACKSAFLLDSWNYMAHSHCNQPFTLKEIPTKQHVVKEIKVQKEKERKYKFILKKQNELLKTLLIVPNLLFSFPIFLMSVIEFNFFIQSPDLSLTAIVLASIFTHLFVKKAKVKISKNKLVLSLHFNIKTIYLSEIEKLDFFSSSEDRNIFFLVIFLESGRTKRLKLIKNKNLISELKELQEYFEENNLSDKLSVSQQAL
ncbi:hypothetical protein ACE193_20645 [Bernardetia sp. OM2101]|uniref:hypothetical protein n=1 Tax=Bernardetia sp. OM2101 TaxID=3344876 RepID=UPI0035CF38F8